MKEHLSQIRSVLNGESEPREGINAFALALRDLRQARGETQSKFWGRFGVTQTRGSRFELGQEIPLPVAILIRLYLDAVVSDGNLWRARRRHSIQKNREINCEAA